MSNNVLSFLLFAAMWHCVAADGKTLVLLDNLNIRDTHSIFFRSLAGDNEILMLLFVFNLFAMHEEKNAPYTFYFSLRIEGCIVLSVELNAG